MNKPMVLVVDDEPDIRELLSLTLAKMNIDSVTADSLKEAYEKLNQEEYFLCLADMRLPDGDGIDLVKYIQVNKPELPVAVITAYGNVEGAVNTLKAGAFDYVSKPINLEMLRNLVTTALELNQSNIVFSDIDLLVGKSQQVYNLREKIQKLSRSQAPVFIHGESGVGKELIAKLIHMQGARQKREFIPVNCAAIPAELLESEFFGHAKGSSPGATANKEGLFVAANGGTLFLNEITELPLQMQVKLLRAIQEKSIRPVGGQQDIEVDVRLLTASHKNLAKEIENGNFRQDLYYRIKVVELEVPPLREHTEDIPLLVDKFLHDLSNQQHIELPKITHAAIQALKEYHFPGNVRELQNILERAVTLCENDSIDVNDLQLPSSGEIVLLPTSNPKVNLTSYLDKQERELILNALEKTKWNRTAAARQLGISFRALRYRLKKLGID